MARFARGWAASLALAMAPLGAAALVLTAGAAPVQGQVVIRVSGGSGGTTPIAKRSVHEYAKLLDLTEEQAETVRTLHEGYRGAFRAAQEAHEAEMESVQEKMRDGDREEGEALIGKSVRAFGEKGSALERSFMADVKQVLTPEQIEKWPAVERHRRRETGMRFGFYSGASVDLIKIVDGMGIESRAAELSDTLAQYEGDLDRLLREMRRRSESLRAPEGEHGFDPQRQERLQRELGEVSRQIRDLNMDYAKRLAAHVPEGDRARFEREVTKRMFPEVYQSSYTQEILGAAKSFGDLDTSQRETIDGLVAQYDRDAAKLNREWSDAIVKAEEDAGGSLGLMMRQWGPDGGAKPDTGIKDARKARRELDERVKQRLEEVLRSDQKDRLPAKKKSQGDGDGPFSFRVNVGATEEDEEE